MTWLYLLGVFALTAAVMAIVGFIGNGIVDGASNALRSRKKRGSEGLRYSGAENLGARYGAVPRIPGTMEKKAVFCTVCGARLEDGERFCPSCGTPAWTYKKNV